jgi:hypothetical protein
MDISNRSLNLSQFTFWLSDLFAKFEDLDGYLFIDRECIGIERLRENAASYSSLAEAQSWMNIVLLESHISNFIGEDWELDDPAMGAFLSVIEQAWTYQVRAIYPAAAFVIKRLLDEEYGDVGLRLISSTG